MTELCQQGCAANGGIPGLTYRSTAVVPFVGAYEADSDVWNWRASATHVSGGRSLKVGYVGTQIVNHFAQVRMSGGPPKRTPANDLPAVYSMGKPTSAPHRLLFAGM